MIKTQLCDLLGIKYPVIQGGMAWIADAQLAAAVSNSGGLGLIAAMNLEAPQLRDEIRKAKELTQNPFGVNIMLMSPFAADVARIVIEEKVQVVTTGAGDPSRYMKDWLAAGIKVLPVVPSAGIARKCEKAGASAIIAEGGEAGGHIGEINTMALTPSVCDAVNIPVVAAGGIADGRGIAAVLMLGACGVQVGTRFLVAKECNVSQNFKDRVLKAKDSDTITTGKRLGHPVRSLKSAFSRDFLKKEYDSSISNEELESMLGGGLRKAAVEGDEKNGCFMAGQVAGLINKEQSCGEIIAEMFVEAETILKGAGSWVK